MELHVVYRSHGGENAKGRPDWYSKLTGLQSFCRAVETARAAGLGVDVVFLNDGPVPTERLDLMRRWGQPVTIQGGSNRRSYLQALALPRRRDWPAEDLVLFAEDDYLWRPDALTALAEAGATCWPDYFAPYGSRAQDTGAPVRWVPHESTTSTFAARVGALRQDERLLVLCSLSGGDFDHTSSLTLQGRPRFGLRDLFDHHPPAEGTPAAKALARRAYLVGLRAAVDVRALRRRSRRRVLLAAEPGLATHMELSWVGPGAWEELAARTREWASGQA